MSFWDGLGSSTPNNSNPPAQNQGGFWGGLPKSASSTPSSTPTPAAPVKTPYFAAVDEKGNSFGFSDSDNDISGAPFFAFRKPGDKATTTDKGRVATTFDPRTPSKLDSTHLTNGRMPQSVSQSIREELGAAYNEDLDHKIALELSGSNARENLQLVGSAANRGPYAKLENKLAKDVVAGKISLFDAQVQDAKQKGVEVPFTGSGGGFWDKLKAGAAQVVSGFKKLPGELLETPIAQRTVGLQDAIKEALAQKSGVPLKDYTVKLIKEEFPGTGDLIIEKDGKRYLNKEEAQKYVNFAGSFIGSAPENVSGNAAKNAAEEFAAQQRVKAMKGLPKELPAAGAPQPQDININKIKDAVIEEGHATVPIDSIRKNAATIKKTLNGEIKGVTTDPKGEGMYVDVMGAKLGRQVTEPIDVVKNADGSYTVLDGNHRLAQKLINGDIDIQAVVHPSAEGFVANTNNAISKPIPEIVKSIETAKTVAKTPAVADAAIAAGNNSLIEEAKKYKSAEEFGYLDKVAQSAKDESDFHMKLFEQRHNTPKNVYFHGTTEEGLKNIMNKGFEITPEGRNAGTGISFTHQPLEAFVHSTSGKIGDNPVPAKVIAIKTKVPLKSAPWETWEKYAQEYLVSKNVRDPQSYTDDPSGGEDKSLTREANEYAVNKIKKEGYNSISFAGWYDNWSTEIRIIDPDIIESARALGSQNDFYTQATKISTLGQNRTDKTPVRTESVAPSNEGKEIVPKIPKETKSPTPIHEHLSNLKREITVIRDTIQNNPAKALVRYVNKEGELPEALGSGSSKFGKLGDQLAQELGYKDSEEARLAFQNYKLQTKREAALKKDIANITEIVRKNQMEDKDAKSLKSFLDKNASKHDAIAKSLASGKSKPQELRKIEQGRSQMAQDHLEAVLKATYNTTPPLARETPQHLLQLTEESYNMSPEEFARIGGSSLPKIIVNPQTPVKDKINLLDYLRTPDRVLIKLGLARESRQLRTAAENYLLELPEHLDIISNWRDRAPSKESNIRIFRYLDGQYNRDFYAGKKLDPLSKVELEIAHEIRAYLREWAERLGLPEDKWISYYITHLWELAENAKEFDEDLAKIIRDKVPGSVYDPFLEKRLGKKGYIEDTWKALDAYAKRGVRKANMDPVLEKLKDAAKRLEDSQERYIKRLADRINLRPTELDNLLDNTIKQLVGYKFGGRPTAYLSGQARKLVFRAFLGLNVGSAIRNLTQGVNTFAKLGTKNTLTGYSKLLTKGLGNQELIDQGVLSQDIIQDRTLSAAKKTMEKVDNTLFYMFDMAEKINRGAAYWGAKAKAINAGFTEQEAMTYAKKIVRDTQFQFGSVDTPVGLNSDLVKIATQFMSFGVKQTEFAAEMIKNKEYGAMLRYVAASVFLVAVIGKAFNIKWTDFVPGYSVFSRFGGLPPALALPAEITGAIFNSPDKFGNQRSVGKKLEDIGKAIPYPASAQIQKSYRGLKSAFDETKYVKGGFIPKAKAAIFGKTNLPTANPELDAARSDQYTQKKADASAVAKELARIKNSSDPASEFDKLAASNPTLAKKVSVLATKPTLNARDSKLMALGVENGNRAKAILDLLGKLKTNEEKAALWEELTKNKVISKVVNTQLLQLLGKQ